MLKELEIENGLIAKLTDLKYSYSWDIKDRASLEKNFREKFQALNHVNLTDSEFDRRVLSLDRFLYICKKSIKPYECCIL